MKGKRVLLAMSGGVDSTASAILLKEQGYSITGVTFRSWDYLSEGCLKKNTGCCSTDAIFEAKKVAEILNFQHHVLDVRDIFRRTVIQNFIDEYVSGRTPNPCVICNTYIKWGRITEFADELKCSHIATGHYARIGNREGRYYIIKGKDSLKDQSYFLWNLTQENLARSVFPLGDYLKNDAKEIAGQAGFTKISSQRESQEICFIPDNDYRRFLRENTAIEKYAKPGPFVTSNGKKLGEHRGHPFYTIGQRKGLNVAAGYPLYVIKIDAQKNIITLGEKEELEQKELLLKPYLLSKYKNLEKELKVETKIRYRTRPASGKIRMKDDMLAITFDDNVSAVTAGQSAVFYEGDDLVGGGIIAG